MNGRVASAGALVLLLASGLAIGQQPPAAIGPQAVQKVKRATVQLRITDAKGKTSEGSGFLAMEPGIVITNAHVLGMTAASAKVPNKVEITISSGEKDETQAVGKVLGVDRQADLAVVRMVGKDLPALLPLELDTKEDLFETQKVYIFGFPFGAQLGKNITVSESSISSLRKGAGGTLESIQINGGMHPGNSGGPVVNSLGQVVGVSVSGIRGTQLNFAVPAASVQSLLAGRIQESKPGEVFRADDQVRVPVAYSTLDPFNRIKEIRVEVWAGKAAPNRAYSPTKADAQPGDGKRETHVLKAGPRIVAGEIPLPKLEAGQVAWVQPVLVFAKGAVAEAWGVPQAFDAALAVERVPAELLVKLADQKERTVQLKASQSLQLSKGKTKFVTADTAELDILEAFSPHPQGARVTTGFGFPNLAFEDGGKKARPAPAVVTTLMRIPPIFIIDETNKLRSRTDFNLNPQSPLALREQVTDFYLQICNAYEAAQFIMPNKEVQAREPWSIKVPLLLKLRGKSEVVDLALTCTYLGMRSREGDAEALVRVAGKLQSRNAAAATLDGQVAGKFTYDVKRNFVSSAKMTISSESTDDDLSAIYAFDIDLKRMEGNPLKIELPNRTAPAAPAAAKGDVLMQMKGMLGPKDDPDTKFGGSRMKIIPIAMTAGKTYSIFLNSAAFDCYLRLIDPSGKIVAEDDDGGGGLNSRIDHVAKATGQYKIVATSFDGKVGGFVLQVLGEKAAGEGSNNNLKKAEANKDVAKGTETFTKPAKSETPTGYLKVVSSPGDYIGQGKSYDYRGDELKVKKTARGIHLDVDGWIFDLGAPTGQFIEPGEYRNAKRFAFSGDSPGLDFFGKGRGNNRVGGEFVVWELELDGDRIVRLAIDFVQRGEETRPPLRGKLRVNSNFE